MSGQRPSLVDNEPSSDAAAAARRGVPGQRPSLVDNRTS